MADRERVCYYLAAAAVVVILLVFIYAWRERDSASAISKAISKAKMMNTHHWDQQGTYQHTASTWGLPGGEGRPNYSGYSHDYGAGVGDPGLLPGTPTSPFVYPREKMSVGAHWVQEGTYGHTAGTLPDFDLSGYYEDVPTDVYA